jgi:hypothetical protein
MDSLDDLPDPSVSKRLKASLISSISSSLRPGRSYVLADRFDPAALPDLVAYLLLEISSESDYELTINFISHVYNTLLQ